MRLPVTSLLPPQTECPPAPGFLLIDNSVGILPIVDSIPKDSQTKPWGSIYSTCKLFHSCNPHSKGEALSIMYTLSDSPPGRSTLTNCTADRHIKTHSLFPKPVDLHTTSNITRPTCIANIAAMQHITLPLPPQPAYLPLGEEPGERIPTPPSSFPGQDAPLVERIPVLICPCSSAPSYRVSA